MEKKHKLEKPLVIMVFKIALFAFVILLYSCLERNPDFENQLWVNNTTSDTLYFQVTKKYIREDSYASEREILPGLNKISSDYMDTSMEIIENNWKYRGDTVEIYRNGVLSIKWAAPLREMPDSIHSFFNKNSWEIKMGGHEDDWEIATFTLTEDDFKKQE